MSASPQKETSGVDSVRNLLGQLEEQISRTEAGRVPGQSDPVQDTISAFQSRMATEIHEIRSLREDLRAAEQRGNEQIAKFAEAMGDVQSQLPGVIDEAVSSRLIEIEERFHQDIKEIHTRSVEAFVQNAQARVGQRLSSLESSMASQIEAMAQLQDYHMRTDRNVQRLLGGLDRLSAELMRLSSLAGAPIVAPRRSAPAVQAGNDPFQQRPVTQDIPTSIRRAPLSPRPDAVEEEEEEGPRRYRKKGNVRGFAPFIYVFAGLVVVVPICLLLWSIVSTSGAGGALSSLPMSRRAASTSDPAALSGTALQLKNASEFASAKNYAGAEGIYRDILKNDPSNTEAINQLASVLFKQQRYEEAATVMKSLPQPELK